MAASHGLRVQTRKLTAAVQQISTVASIYMICQIQHRKYTVMTLFVRQLALENYSYRLTTILGENKKYVLWNAVSVPLLQK